VGVQLCLAFFSNFGKNFFFWFFLSPPAALFMKITLFLLSHVARLPFRSSAIDSPPQPGQAHPFPLLSRPVPLFVFFFGIVFFFPPTLGLGLFSQNCSGFGLFQSFFWFQVASWLSWRFRVLACIAVLRGFSSTESFNSFLFLLQRSALLSATLFPKTPFDGFLPPPPPPPT